MLKFENLTEYSEEIQQEINSMTTKHNKTIDDKWIIIDDLFYRYFGISDEEKKVITTYLKNSSLYIPSQEQ